MTRERREPPPEARDLAKAAEESQRMTMASFLLMDDRLTDSEAGEIITWAHGESSPNQGDLT